MAGKKKDNMKTYGIPAIALVVGLLLGMYVVPQFNLAVDEKASSICERATVDIMGDPADLSEFEYDQWLVTCFSCCETGWAKNPNQLGVCKEKCTDAVYGDPEKTTGKADEVVIYEFNSDAPGFYEASFYPSGWVGAYDGLTTDGNSRTGAVFDFDLLGSYPYASISYTWYSTSATFDFVYDFGAHDAEVLVQCENAQRSLGSYTGSGSDTISWTATSADGDCGAFSPSMMVKVLP